MKKGVMAKKAERLTLSIIAISIIAIFLLSILPWISVEESDYVREDLHFNLDMMKKSDNNQIVELANDINFINICLWFLIILGLLSFLGSTIHASGKITLVAHILLFIGCATLIFSILIINFQIDILGKIESAPAITASTIFSPFNYSYIILGASFLLLIFSTAYVWNMSMHSIQKIKDLIKDKKNDKAIKKERKKLIMRKKEEKPPVEKEKIKIKEDKKRANVEEWLVGEVQNMEKQVSEERINEPEEVIIEKPSLKEEQIDIRDEELEEPAPEEEETTTEQLEDTKKEHVFQPEKTVEKSEESEQVPVAKSFEKALSSAIKKKQTEIDDLEPLDSGTKEEIEKSEELPENEEIPKKKISVRCPQCKHIFTFQKEGKITRIKCPECGKEGVVK